MTEIMLQNYLDPIAKVWGNEGVALYAKPANKHRKPGDKRRHRINKKGYHKKGILTCIDEIKT